MTLKANKSLNLSDHSLITQGNELIATSIGRTANGTTLSCCLNVENQDYRYCKTEEQILGALLIVEKKLSQWAFRQIQKSTHYHTQKNNAIFLPEALSHGDYGALSKFLGNLKSNKINSYIKLNMQDTKGHFHKATTVLKPLVKIVNQRKIYSFAKMRLNMFQKQRQQERILVDIEKFSSIENKLSEVSEPTAPKIKSIHVTFVPIRISSQKFQQLSIRKSSYTYREHQASRKINDSKNSISTYVDINDLINDRKVKTYEFKHITTVRLDGERVSYARKV